MKKFYFVFLFLGFITESGLFAQTTVFTDDFNRGAVVTPLSNGGTPTMTWTTASTSSPAGTSTTTLTTSPNYVVQLYTNTTTAAAGRTYCMGALSTYSSPFNATLSSNTGAVTWTFNMKTNRSTALSGFDGGNYGSAVILATNNSNPTNTGANGYAVVLVKGTTNNAIKLVSFTSGLILNSNVTTIIGPSSDLAAMTNYVSVKVVYTPSTNTWQLYYRDDASTTEPTDPTTGTLTQVGSNTVNSLYTSVAMTNFGFLWNHSNGAYSSNKGIYDNFKVTIAGTPPTLSATTSVTGITTSAGSSGGTISAIGSANVTVSGICWNTSTGPTTSNSKTTDGGAFSSPGSFTSSLSGLSAGTTYYVRAYATNTAGTSYGAEVSFRTLASVTTSSATNIDATTATVAGSFTSPEAYTQKGIVWNTAGSPTVSSYDGLTTEGSGTGNGSITGSMSSLTPGVKYYVRAYVTNTGGTSYGSEVNFTTLAPTAALSSNNPAIAAGDIVLGQAKQVLYRFTIAETNYAATLSSVSFTSTNTSESDITKYQLYYNTSDVIPVSPIGSDITSSLGTGTHTFSGLSQSIAKNATGYFWITADVSGSATLGNTIAISALTTGDLSFSTANTSKSGTAYAGGTQTINATPTVTLSDLGTQVASGHVGQGSSGVVLYKFQVATATAGVTLTAVSVANSGTYASGDFTNLKLLYKATNDGPSGASTLSTLSNPDNSSPKVFAFSQNIAVGNTGYFWVTGDVASGAVAGHTFTITPALAHTDLTFSATVNYGTDATTAGGTQTITAVPTLSSPTSASVGTTTATLGATVLSDGGDALTERGVVWNTSASPTILNNKTAASGTTVDLFTVGVTGLPSGTLIYYRGYATNNDGTGYTSDATFYTMSTEPTAHAGSFTATAASSSSVNLSWSAAAGASGYIILQNLGSDPTGLPADASGYSVGNTIGDGTVAAITTNTSATISSLTTSTQYNFSIIPFAWDASHAATYNYKTDGSIPTANAITFSSGSDIITADNESSGINYLTYSAKTITATTDGLRVWSFTVRDGGASGDADNVGTTLTALSIAQGSGNTASSWSSLINAAALFEGGTKIADLTIGASTLTCNGQSIAIMDNSSRTFDVYLNFTTTATDNSILQFKLLNSGATASASGSGFSAFSAVNSNASGSSNKIQVTATKIAFGQQPSNIALGGTMSPSPTVRAEDVNNNVDADYTSIVTLTTNGTFDASATTSANASSGTATFSNLIFNATGTGLTLTANSGSFGSAASSSFDVTAPATPGELLLEENFTGTVGTNLTANGWTAHSGAGTTPATISSPGLTYPNYASSNIGNAASVGTSGEDVDRTLSTYITSSTSQKKVYVAALVNVSATQATGDYPIHVGPSPAGSSELRGRIYIKQGSSSSKVKFGIVPSTTASVVYATAEYDINTTYLLVEKYAFTTTSATATLYINPTISSEPATSSASLTETVTTSGGVGTVSIRQGTASSTPTLKIDGLRVATDWGSLMGSPIYTTSSTINAGNYSSVSVTSGATLTVGGTTTVNGSLSVSSGTLALGTNNVTVTGNVTNNSAITSSSGKIVLSGGSSAHTVSGSAAFQNLELSDALGASLGSNVTLNGTLTLTSGTLTVGAHTLTLASPIAGTASNLSADNTSSIAITGSTAGINVPSSVSALSGLTLNNTSGSTLQGSLNVKDNLSLSGGTLNLNGQTLTLTSGSTLTCSGGSLSAEPTFAGIVNVTYTPSSASATLSGYEIPSSSTALNNLTVSSTGEGGVKLTAGATINGNLTVSSGAKFYADNGTPIVNYLKGNWSNSGTYVCGTSKLVLNGSSKQTMYGSTHYDLEIDNAAGVDMTTDETVTNSLILTNGTFSIGAHTLTLDGTISQTGGSLAGGSTSSFVYGGTSTTLPSLDLLNLTNNASGTLTLGGPVSIANGGTLALQGGTLASGSNLSMLSTSTISRSGGSMTGTPQGSGTYTAGYTGSSKSSGSELDGAGFTNLTMELTSGEALTLSNQYSVPGTISMASGNIDLNGKTLTLGTGTSNKGTLSYTSGSMINSGTFKRWFDGSAVSLGAVEGRFPTGTTLGDASAYIAGTPSTGGTVSVQFADANGTTEFSPAISEDTLSLNKRSNMNWTISSGNSFAGSDLSLRLSAAAIYAKDISYIAAPSSLDMILVDGTLAPGNYSAGTGSVSAPFANRTGLSDTDFPKTLYMASTSLNALPVELNSLSAAVDGRCVTLEWTTATEINSYKFIVERCPAGNSKWAIVGEVRASNYSNSPKYYKYVDKNVNCGHYTYRLKMIDNDGTYEYSKITTDAVIAVPTVFSLAQNYPNPFNPTTKITYAVPVASHVVLELYSITGKKVASLVNENVEAGYYDIQVNMNQYRLPSGVYIYRINGKELNSGKQFSSVKKMMLLK